MSDPRIIAFDLETLPNLNEALKIWPRLGNYPGLTLKASINTMICFGYSLLGDSGSECLSAWDFPAWETDVNNDYLLVKEAREILEHADAVITHNGKRFDWKFFQTRLLVHGLPPLPKINHVDTKALASSNLFFFSNKLDLLAESLKLQRKLDHEGWDLWVKVAQRDQAAQRLMAKYCAQDVTVLKELFRKLRPFAHTLPNHNVFAIGGNGINLCPLCGSTRIVRNGVRATQTVTYQRYHCIDCGGHSRTNINDKMPRSI